MRLSISEGVPSNIFGIQGWLVPEKYILEAFGNGVPNGNVTVKQYLTWVGLRNEYALGTTCNETHPAFWQLPKNKRKQRNFGGIPGFGDDPNGINPGDMWNVFETGTILLESDEGKKTTVRVDKLSRITGTTDNPW